jgi:hypothetical protein
VRGEHFLLTAAFTATLYLVCTQAFGWSVVTSTVIAFVFGFGYRLISQLIGWEEWEPWEPAQAPEKPRATLGEGLRAEFVPQQPQPPAQHD